MNRESLLNRPKSIKAIELQGELVYIRKLTAGEVARLSRDYSSETTSMAGIRYTVCRAVCTEHGERIFTDQDVDGALADQDFEWVRAISDAIAQHSGLHGSSSTAKNA